MDGNRHLNIAMIFRNFARLTLISGVALAAIGCQPPDNKVQTVQAAPEPPPRPEPKPPPASPPPKAEKLTPRRSVIGSSTDGRPIECLEFGNGQEVVLIMASIHGNEAGGTPLVRQLAEYISNRPALVQDRKLVLIPVVNPDGVAKRSRGNAHGVDLNRNFPAGNYKSTAGHGSKALSEPESKAIHSLLTSYKPRRIVSLHQPANHGPACIDFDGPGDAIAKAMSSRCDLPVKRLGAKSGSLGSYAGTVMGVPIITVELPTAVSSMKPEAVWTRYGEMLLAAVAYPKAVTLDRGMQVERATTVSP